MFVDVAVVLTGAESTIFLFDEKEGRRLWRVGRSYLSRGEVLVQEVLGGFAFVGRERIYFPDLRGEGVIEVDLMIVRSGRRNVVGGFLREHRGEGRVFGGKGDLGFGFLRSCREFGSIGQFGNDR